MKPWITLIDFQWHIVVLICSMDSGNNYVAFRIVYDNAHEHGCRFLKGLLEYFYWLCNSVLNQCRPDLLYMRRQCGMKWKRRIHNVGEKVFSIDFQVSCCCSGSIVKQQQQLPWQLTFLQTQENATKILCGTESVKICFVWLFVSGSVFAKSNLLNKLNFLKKVNLYGPNYVQFLGLHRTT